MLVPSREGRRKQSREDQVQQLQTEVEAYQALRPLQGSMVPTLVAHGCDRRGVGQHWVTSVESSGGDRQWAP